MGDESPMPAEALIGSQAQRGPPKCHPANCRFYDHIAGLRSEADAAGRCRQAQSYARVLQSLRRYPLPVRSAHEAAGLEGVGKVVMSIFEQVLDASADKGVVLEDLDDGAWLRVSRRRLQRALDHPTVHGGPGSGAVSSMPLGGRGRGRRLSGAPPARAKEAVAAPTAAEATGAETLPGTPANLGSPARPSAAPASKRSPLGRAPALAPAAVGRKSLAAKCRRAAAACSGALAVGTPQWCVLAALGLYAGDAPNRALAWPDIERGAEKLRRLLPRCSEPRRCAAFRLMKRGLVEEGGPGKYRLTERGSIVAETAVRKLEVPLTALSPLRLADAAAPEQQAPLASGSAASGHGTEDATHAREEGSFSDDDTPLCLLRSRIAAVASPQKRPQRAPEAHSSGLQLPPEQPTTMIVSISKRPDACPLPGAPSFLRDAASSPTRSMPGAVSGFSAADTTPAEDQLVAVLTSSPEAEAKLDIDALRFEPHELSVAPLAARSPPRQRLQPEPLPAPLPAARSPPRKRRRELKPAQSAPPVPAALAASPAACPASPPARQLSTVRSAPASPLVAAAAARPRHPPALGGISRGDVSKIRPSGCGRLVLILDHREVGAGREHAARGALLADLAKHLGTDAVEGRCLPLGDVLWLWREDSPGSEAGGAAPACEYVAGWVVERKTFHDLSASIMDGRYDEQKIRLLEAPGLDGVVYLVEGAGPLFGVAELTAAEKAAAAGAGRGFGQRLLNRSLPTATLSTTAAHTQLISGFHVVHTTSTSHTVTFLVAMHRALQEFGPPGLGERAACGGAVPYREFAERTRKTCQPRAFEAFGRMLRVVPHCGPEATEALVDEFQTPHAFAAALRDSSDTDLLLRLKARRGGRAPVSASALAACRELFVA